ncbi:hypothetical protein GOBAR_AA16955 [Gossypium barbadense]|uniref:Uncharacterized protein n=1 Tax=Gossypium barbadense TaxID=3634 RepID=A0A2P5XK28_GOSBA|nr:hypothetical protein GOBAR_AA16955 [Gossypium barbadense]
MGSYLVPSKPHAVCIPYPAQGHVIPMLLVANLLHFKGFHITFVNTEYNHERLLKSRGPHALNGLPDFETYMTNGYLDTIIDWIPGMKNIRIRDLPSFVRTTDPNDIMLNFAATESERSAKASAIIVNTFDELEHDVVKALSSIFPKLYTTWPLHLLSTTSHKEPQCLQWLDSKEPKSVVYVNFGSITVMTANQLVEFAWGLANSKQPFFWIIRPDLVRGDSAVLPPEFTEETKERSLMASWCLQESVLNHTAIGGFLTHSGWNSTIESISSGVPMISWPFFAEQQTNCRFACTQWGIGMEIDNDVKRDEVEKLVRELMEGVKGMEMREKAMEFKKKAEEAAMLNGPSFVNLENLIKEVLL